MPATTDKAGEYAARRARLHPRCWVCAPTGTCGLGVEFSRGEGGTVTGTFSCDERFTGYPGLLHGGVIASLLDGAMTNCLMARGLGGVTADLRIRYVRPVLIGRPALVSGWWETTRGRVHVMGAELRQDGQVLATATAKFMGHPDLG